LRVWEDEKLVYDVTPESQILAESAEYAKTFAFYPGDEAQLPDPDIESIEGVGNVPAYRGRCYFVKKRYDATDRRGTPPSYKFEVACEATNYAAVTLVTNSDSYSGEGDSLTLGANLGFNPFVDLVRVSPNGLYAVGADSQNGDANLARFKKFNTTTEEWEDLGTLPDFPTAGAYIFDFAWHPSSNYVAAATNAVPGVIVWKRVGDTFTRLPDTSEPITVSTTRGQLVAWDSVGQRLAVGTNSGIECVYLYDFVGELLVNRRGTAPPGSNFLGGFPRSMTFLPGLGSRYLFGATDTHTFMIRCTEDPMEVCAAVNTDGAAGVMVDESGGYLIAVGDGAVRVYEIVESVVGSEALNLESTLTTGVPTFCRDAGLSGDKRYLAIAAETGAETYPYIYSVSDATPPVIAAISNPAGGAVSVRSASWSALPTVQQYLAGATTFNAATLAAARRCGMADTDFDLSEMAGITI